jgi:ParB family chromosome partitioning protein
MRVEEIPIEKIIVPPERARATFTEEQHSELVASIKTHGFTVPILVSDNGDGTYTLIDGEHRLQIAKELGYTKVPAVVTEGDQKKIVLLNVLANTARGTQNPMDVARALLKAKEAGATEEELAAATGHTVDWVRFYLAINDLPEVYQEALREGRLKVGHVRECLRLPSPEEVDACLGTALKLSWTVDTTKYYVEHRLQSLKAYEAAAGPGPPPPPPTVEQAKEIIEWGDCMICNRKVPRKDLRMPVVCPDCYELAQYIVSVVGTGPEAMQKIYEALLLYNRMTQSQVPQAAQQLQQSQPPQPQTPTSSEDEIVERIARKVLEKLGVKVG